jgi:DGQHR domain-containing protein
VVAIANALRVPAIAIRQGTRTIYSFAVDGKLLHDFTTVSRVRRTTNDILDGYQRPEAAAHIRGIRRYLESEGAMLPNAIVLAFDQRVRFEGSSATEGFATPGHLVIPVDPATADIDKPALLVDGQQRAAAIRDAEVDHFPVAAVGFIADTTEEQRTQFILVNNTKPLPRGLVHELLPASSGHLPPLLQRRQLPAQLLSQLNTDLDSPFHGRISTPTTPDGYIKDNSVLKMIENSLFDGALFDYRDPDDVARRSDEMLRHLKTFWHLVSHMWPDAWNLPPRKSRLTHGAGIQALGYVMDALTEGTPIEGLDVADLAIRIKALDEVCAWTAGSWQLAPGDQRPWNALQNTSNDVRILTNLLVRKTRKAV